MVPCGRGTALAAAGDMSRPLLSDKLWIRIETLLRPEPAKSARQ
jgi:hypothetical protein